MGFVAPFLISWNLSRIKDEIMLRMEFIYISCLGTLFAVIYAVIFLFAHDWRNKGETDKKEILDDMMYLVFPSPVLYSLVLVQTQWVLYQYRNLEKKQKEMEENASKNGKLRVSVALKDVMQDYEGYMILMEYLVKCVCSENLLYVSETLQFMKDLSDKYGVKPTSTQAQNYLDSYAIPDELNPSSIMTASKATSVRFLRICEKYILEQSEFEINISHRNRKNLKELFDQLRKKVDEVNPKEKKLLRMLGDDSKHSVSRRASQTASSRMILENGKDKIQRKLSRDKSNSSPGLRPTPSPTNGMDAESPHTTTLSNAPSSASKQSHECLQDYLWLADDENMVQRMYDCLCATLGDVYSNLNDAGMRFMQTDVYFRWYDQNIRQNTKRPQMSLHAAIRRSTDHSVSREPDSDSPVAPSSITEENEAGNTAKLDANSSSNIVNSAES